MEVDDKVQNVAIPLWQGLVFDASFWNAVAWPLAIVICLLILKKPISNLLKSFTKLMEREVKYNSKTGAFELSSANQNVTSLNKEGIEENLSLDKALETIPDYLRNKIEQLSPFVDQAAQDSNISKELWLKARLIEFLIAHNMEIIYRNVFGSQLKALNHLMVNQGASREQIKVVYEEAKEHYPDFYSSYSFDEWLGFMVQASLISTKDGNCYITDDGKGFLTYLNHHQYSFDRVF